MTKNSTVQKGFSLLELFLTLTIISIIAVFSLPNFGNIAEIQRLKSAVRDLHAAISLTRSLAIKHAETITLCVQAQTPSPQCAASGAAKGNWQNGWLVFRDVNNNRQFDFGDQLLSTNKAYKSVSINSSAQKSLVRINALGASILSNQTWEFCLFKKNSPRGIRLILSSPGQIRHIKIDSC